MRLEQKYLKIGDDTPIALMPIRGLPFAAGSGVTVGTESRKLKS